MLQNGKIIGAVTHVLINDPTTGYGIFIENMLSQMGDPEGESSADRGREKQKREAKRLSYLLFGAPYSMQKL